MTRSIFTVAMAVNLAIAAAQPHSPPPAGDAAAGKAIFEGTAQCIACHTVDARGGVLGPDLSWIGVFRTPESLMTSLVDPDARIAPEYATIVVETRTGNRLEGVALNEDDLSIQMRDSEQNLRSFIKSDLKALRREARSLMPSYRTTLSSGQRALVVAYLRSLRTLPAIETPAQPRSIPAATENAAFFDRPTRDQDERPDLLIAALEIPQGATVADIGSGTGYFTWRLAEKVGRAGKVYAVDVQQSMLDLTREAVRRHNLDNVEYVLSAGNDVQLPQGSLDLAFIAYAYHEFAEPKTMLSAIRRALKPGGRLFVLEYAQETNRSPASPLHSMRFDDIRAEIEPPGFVVDRVLDFLPVGHGVIFRPRY